MADPYDLMPEVDPKSLLPWKRSQDKDRLNRLALKQKIATYVPPQEQVGYKSFYNLQDQALNVSAANVRASESTARGKAAQRSRDQQRWAEEEQAKAQKELQARYEEWVKAHPYQNQGSVTYGPGGQVINGGEGFAGGGNWQSGQPYNGSDVELAQLARAAGFPEDQIPMAVAVALAESGGRADAVSPTSDYGLWQINQVHSGRPGFENRFDPLTNAKLAYAVWKDAGGSWSPWVTAQNGLEQKFMGRARAAVGNPQYQQPWVQVPSYMTNSGASTGLRNTVISKALAAIGTPYVWGGNSLSQGVDCSGLVQQVYQAVGISLPRTANAQTDGTSEFNAIGNRVSSISQLRPGDLIAWPGNRAGESASFVGHVAIYQGNGYIIEAPSQGLKVRTRQLRSDEHVYGVHLTLPGD